MELEFITTQLLAEHSKPQTMRLIDWIGTDTTRTAALMQVFLGADYRLTQRAAWIVGDLGQQKPELLLPYLHQMTAQLLRTDTHDAVKRNVVRVFEKMNIPDDIVDALADACFQFVNNTQEAVAIRAFSMTVLARICAKIPELWPELRLTIEAHLHPESKPAFKHRAKVVLALATKAGY